MARDKNRPARANEDEQQEEMTVVILRFKGSGDTLQKGFETVSQALAALGPVAPPQQQRAVITRTAPQLPAARVNGNGRAEAEPLDVEADHEDVADDAPPAPARAPRKPSEPRKYTFLSEVDLNGVDGVSLKQYAAEKNPQSENDKYLVACAWLMKHADCEAGFTPNHVFTCFRAMGWKEQKDFTQPMRLMKQKKSYFDVPSKGTWKLNGHGMSAAEAIGQEG